MAIAPVKESGGRRGKAGGRAGRRTVAAYKAGDVMKAKTPPSVFLHFAAAAARAAITARATPPCQIWNASVDEGVTAITEGCNVLGFRLYG
ncbi:hypothetical protein KCP71_03210 [Salmonella enterica subsp. enterica]|nr:hypothetical protein KCP71_03210 [Salmonella enterica subsp. enterica]